MRQTALAAFHDTAPVVQDFRASVLEGLSSHPKRLEAKFFYDAEGSRLFDLICELPEYYPTRTEIGIMERHGAEMAALIGRRCQLVELGSGSSVKVRPLLERLEDPAGYVAVDISRDHLIASADALARDYPELEVMALCADYTQGLAVPPPGGEGEFRRVGYFPGSTIGNMDPVEAQAFLVALRPALTGGGLLIGVDLRKDPQVLHDAYNDSQGVTAAFNLNLLARINRELDGGFDLAAFEHKAFYDEALGRIEMHLVSRRDQIVTVAGRRFAFAAGETIHTENSCKYSVEGFRDLARRAGYAPAACWTDDKNLFSVHYLACPG
ncbi:MAG TPA: L-histidine N(alpha)-methyltransferase [Azospirillaceae bacterium]|nr:L-histidine N(alpha)-methyltransferase [Azospirillaceae bacterium]